VTPLPARRSRVWAVVFRVSYRFIRLLDPLIRSWIANGAPGLDGIVELRTVGRRTGRPRRTLVTLLRVDDRFYVGHPNGTAAWLTNLLAAGWVDVEPPGAAGPRYAVDRLPPGPERDGVIRATWTQQPFPANLLYRVARRHVAAAGEYVRLVPGGSDGPVPTAAAVP
jgi:deazaflavin-dependent oxidoreductase (nitroreductase family)